MNSTGGFPAKSDVLLSNAICGFPGESDELSQAIGGFPPGNIGVSVSVCELADKKKKKQAGFPPEIAVPQSKLDKILSICSETAAVRGSSLMFCTSLCRLSVLLLM